MCGWTFCLICLSTPFVQGTNTHLQMCAQPPAILLNPCSLSTPGVLLCRLFRVYACLKAWPAMAAFERSAGTWLSGLLGGTTHRFLWQWMRVGAMLLIDAAGTSNSDVAHWTTVGVLFESSDANGRQWTWVLALTVCWARG